MVLVLRVSIEASSWGCLRVDEVGAVYGPGVEGDKVYGPGVEGDKLYGPGVDGKFSTLFWALLGADHYAASVYGPGVEGDKIYGPGVDGDKVYGPAVNGNNGVADARG